MQDSLLWPCTPTAEMVRLAPSDIQGAGMGVFASSWIGMDTVLGEYYGKIVPQESEITHAEMDYACALDCGDSVIPDKGCLLAYINDCTNLPLSRSLYTRVNMPYLDYNCKFVQIEQSLYVVATRHLQKGEELYINYGRAYWNSRLAQ